MAIPVKLSEADFQTFVKPHLSRAKREGGANQCLTNFPKDG